MQITMTGRKFELTDALRTFTEEKLTKIKRHFDRITGIDVIFDIEKLNKIVEANIILSGGNIHAKAESEDMYSAVDSLIDKLDRKIIKHKEKMQNHRE